MYIPRSVLVLLVIIYVVFLLSTEWINQPDGAWYRPFLVGLLIICVAAWSHWKQDSDEV